MVLFLFVIMLLGVDRREALAEELPGQRTFAVGLGALLAAEILFIVWRGVAEVAGNGSVAIENLNSDPGNVLALARVLFSRYLLPYEATSILLVVAVVGVMVMTRRISEMAQPSASQSSNDDLEAA
jgi:NADH-quinone oxidoreductase subunit J